MAKTDTAPAGPTTTRIPERKRRAGEWAGLRRAPPAPTLLQGVFWIDVVFCAVFTALSLGAVAPFAAAIVMIAFSYREMGKRALWARVVIAVVVGGVAAPVAAVSAYRMIVSGGVLDAAFLYATPVFVWQVAAALASTQALLRWSRTEQERRRDAARVRPLPAGKRHFLRRGRRDRSDPTPHALTAVVVLDVLLAVIAVIYLVIDLAGAPNLFALGPRPKALALALPAIAIALLCWQRHRLGLTARLWFGGAVALVSAAVAGLTSPWTLALAAYAVVSGLGIAHVLRELARRGAETKSGGGA